MEHCANDLQTDSLQLLRDLKNKTNNDGKETVLCE